LPRWAASLRRKLARVEAALAHWLAQQRVAIEREAARATGALDPASSEAEALRRFRSFALLALARGAAAPSLEGLRVSLRRSARAIDTWIDAACALAGPDAQKVREPLATLRAQFVAALSASSAARSASATPTPSARRAVASAIDRIADLFLAADADTGAIVDANPAACALLGLARPELLTRTLDSLSAPGDRAICAELLDAIAEGGEPQRSRLALLDSTGGATQLEVRVTRFVARGRTLALLLGRA
jgi:PAS domain S-box-containing protein